MRISIITAGSRGDIQPYLALAKGLKKSGMEVVFAANSNFSDLVTEQHIDFFPINIDSYQFIQSSKARAWLESDSLVKLAYATSKAIKPVLGQLLTDTFKACQNCDLIIYHSFTLPFIFHFAKILNTPSIPASIYPLATRDHPALPLNLQRNLGGLFNLFSHYLVNQFTWQIFSSNVKIFLKGESIGPIANPYTSILREKNLILCGYSSNVIPRPFDLPSHVVITGYWFLESKSSWRAPDNLLHFLDTSPKPIFIGFGSMGNPNKNKETLKICAQALENTSMKAVLVGGWSELDRISFTSRNIYPVSNLPFEYLFPHLSAIIHHGGAGTTSLALRAGKPNIVVPHFSDNFFWGRRVTQLGVGPKPIPRKKLTAKNLSEAISIATTNQKILTNAAKMGQKIQAEEGVLVAVRNITENVSNRYQPSTIRP